MPLLYELYTVIVEQIKNNNIENSDNIEQQQQQQQDTQ